MALTNEDRKEIRQYVAMSLRMLSSRLVKSESPPENSHNIDSLSKAIQEIADKLDADWKDPAPK